MRKGIFLAACLAVVTGSVHAQTLPSHTDAEERVVAEHAEVVPVAEAAGQMMGYLTLWNGTKSRADLTAVSSPAFRSVSMHRLDAGGGIARMPLVSGIVPIPARAELVMRRDGLYLTLEQPVSALMPGDKVTFDLAFDDGTTISTAAIVRESDREPVDHHHGEDDG